MCRSSGDFASMAGGRFYRLRAAQANAGQPLVLGSIF